MSEESMTPSITIRFIRFSEPGQDDKKNDDVLRINPSEWNCGMFKCSFTLGKTTKQYSHEFEADADNLYEYLRLTLALLRRDDDPFENIQFDLPAYPQFLFTIKTFGPKKQTLILDAISSVVKDWPVSVVKSKDNAPCKDYSCGRYFASCDCMDETE